MSLITRNNRNFLAAASGTIARGLVNELARNAVQSASSSLQNYFGTGRQALMPAPEIRNSQMRGLSGASSKKNSKKKSKRRRRGGGTGSPNTSISSMVTDRIRVTLADAFALVNTSSGVYNNYFQLAVTYTATKDMITWLPRANTIAGSFRFFKVLKIVIRFQPTLPYTVGGYLALCVDNAPDSTAPGSISVVVRKDPHVVGDIKDAHTIVWTPRDDELSLDKLVNAADVTTAPEHVCQGVIQLYSANTQADTTTTIGILSYDVEMEFFGLC